MGLLQGNSSSHRRDFYCLNCFNSYTTKNKLKKHEDICNNHNSCCIVMPGQVNTTIKYNLVKTIQKNHLQKKKLDMSLLVGQCLQNVHLIKKENKLDYYRGKDCIEKLCKKLKESATEIINHKEKEAIPLTH